MQIKERLLTPGRGGRPGQRITPKGLVIHWTANTDRGADAAANRNYFENHPQSKVSAHYVVDEKEIIRCVPEQEMAYHVGASHYNPQALQRLSAYPNNCTIGIEMCVNQDGDFHGTYENTVLLAADILRRHDWDTDDLWRHYDVTGKECPAYFARDDFARQYGFASAAAGWAKFKQDVTTLLEASRMFADISTHWAQKEILYCTERGLFNKDQTLFRPNDALSRGEFAVVLCRLLKLLGR